MSIERLEGRGDRLLRQVSASKGITFGTSAPYQFGRVGFDRVGFADTGVVGFEGFCREADLLSLIPVARQHILRVVAEADLPTSALKLTVIFSRGRARLFVDQNPASMSQGKKKRGITARFHLEIIDRNLVKSFGLALPRVYL